MPANDLIALACTFSSFVQREFFIVVRTGPAKSTTRNTSASKYRRVSCGCCHRILATMFQRRWTWLAVLATKELTCGVQSSRSSKFIPRNRVFCTWGICWSWSWREMLSLRWVGQHENKTNDDFAGSSSTLQHLVHSSITSSAFFIRHSASQGHGDLIQIATSSANWAMKTPFGSSAAMSSIMRLKSCGDITAPWGTPAIILVNLDTLPRGGLLDFCWWWTNELSEAETSAVSNAWASQVALRRRPLRKK